MPLTAKKEASSHCEEREALLWEAMKHDPRDEKTFDRLVDYYLPLVEKIVRGIAIRVGHFVEPRELVGAGVMGLNEAISRFSPERNVQFSTYATPRIRGAILDELRRRDPLTLRQRRSVRKIKKAVADFVMREERAPSNREISGAVGMNMKQVELYLGLGTAPINLEAEFREGLRYVEVLADQQTPQPDKVADRSISMQEMREAIRKLGERDQQLLFFRHHERLSGKEIARIFEISPGRVSQLYNAIVTKLRALMRIDSEM